MADRTIIAFLRIDLQPTAEEIEGGIPQSVKLHTGLGTLYPVTSQWSDYLGTGAVLTLSSVTNDSTTAATEFKVDLAIPPTEEARFVTTNLYNRIRSTSLENRGVCLHAATIPEGGGTPEPQLLLVGKVANCELAPDRVSVQIYTGASLLNHVVGGPASYNDLTHKRFVDAEDSCLRYQNDTTLREVYFP